MGARILVNNCFECPHYAHSGAFTEGGALPLCGKLSSPNYRYGRKELPNTVDDTGKRTFGGKIPNWCPLRVPDYKEKTMTENLDHLLGEASRSAEEKPSEDILQRISRLAQTFVERSEEMKRIEEQLKEKAKEVNKIGQELLPEAMLSVDMTSFQLASGKMVSIKEQLSCSVKDYDKLYDFLEERGDDALMKINIELGKLPKSVLALVVQHLLKEFDVAVEPKMYIHPATLKSYFTKLCGIGSGENSELPISAVDSDMVSTFTYYKTTVK